MTPYLLVFGGAFIAFSVASGIVGSGIVDGWHRWLFGVAAAALWLGLQGVLNGLRMRRAMPRLRAISDAVSQGMRSFDEATLGRTVRRGKPLLVSFRSDEDLGCLRMAPLFTEAALALKGRASVGRVDVDRQPAAAAVHGIVKVPTLILFKDGEERARLVGVANGKELGRWISRNL